MAKILIVEDESGIRELISLFLENRKFVVTQVDNGRNALNEVSNNPPDLILLDIEMPQMDGFEVCMKIREKVEIPIIFISSRREMMDKLKSFELGGDDYITKPFDFAELEARINANLRRYQRINMQKDANVLSSGQLTIHFDSHQCFRDGQLVQLSTREMQILQLLAKHPNQVFSNEQIYDSIWGIDSIGDVQTVKVHILNLRRKIEKDHANPEHIITVRGFGYRFNY